MIGICIEAGISCPSCETQIPLNALVPKFMCAACGEEVPFDRDSWNAVIEDALDEAPYLEEGSGSSSNIFGTFRYKVLYGRLQPRYDGTRTSIPFEDVLAGCSAGKVIDPDSGRATFVRSCPEEYREAFPGVVALVGEDPEIIPSQEAGGGGLREMEEAARPVAFACESCGGFLVIDSSRRAAECEYCGSKASMPDDLWQSLHPNAIVLKRWYLVVDSSQRPFSWEDEIWDLVSDSEGNLYGVFELDSVDSGFVLASLSPDRTPRWLRTDLDQLSFETTDGEPRLCMTPEGEQLLVFSREKPRMASISCEDGSLIRWIENPEAVVSEDTRGFEPFSAKGCIDLACFPDGTLIMLRDLHEEDSIRRYCRLLRYDLDGTPLQLWEPPEQERGILESLKRWIRRKRLHGDPWILGSCPEKICDSDMRLAAGPDGSLCATSREKLYRFAGTGEKAWGIDLPCSHTRGRPVVDADGSVYVLARTCADTTQILRVSPDGVTVDVVAENADDDDPLYGADVIALGKNGSVFALGYSGKFVVR